MFGRRMITLLLLVLLIAACGGQDGGGDATPDASPSTAALTLHDHPVTRWLLSELDGSAPLPGSIVVLDLSGRAEDRLEGWSDCANFVAPFAADASSFAISRSEPLAGVDAMERPCQTPEGGKEQDDRFYAALTAATGYAISAERLELRDASGATRLVFVPRPPFALDPALADVEWTLRSIDGAPLAAEVPITLVFADERLSGTDGCNAVGGPLIAASDGRLTIASIGGTEMACDEPIMTQATAVTERLRNARGYRAAPGLLRILDANDAPVLVFTSQAATVDVGLLGARWELTRLDNAAPLAGTTPYIEFSPDGARGDDGCNGFATPPVVARDGRFSFPPPSREAEECDAAVMAQADAFIDALRAGTTWALAGDTLTIGDDAGAPLLELRRGGATVDPALRDVVWVVVAIDSATPLAERTPTLGFSATGFSGWDGCNAMAGDVLTAPDGVLQLARHSGTTEGCPTTKPTGAHAAALHAALAATTGYQIVEDQLELLDASGAVRLTLVRHGASIDPALVSIIWEVQAIGADVPIAGNPLSLEFADGGYSGWDGCNWFGGVVTVGSAGALALGLPVQPAAGCPPPDGMQIQSERFHSALASATAYRHVDDRLELLDAHGDVRVNLAPRPDDPLLGTSWR